MFRRLASLVVAVALLAFAAIGVITVGDYVLWLNKKQEQRLKPGSFHKAAEEKGTPVSCISNEVAQAVLDAYKESQEEGDMTLVLFIMLGACQVVTPDVPIPTAI